MSAIVDNYGNPAGVRQRRDPKAPPEPMIKDAYGRLVPDRTSNKPFINYAAWKVKDDERRAETARLRKEREERIAKGEDPGPEVHDPYEPRDLTLVDLLKFIVFLLVGAALAGQFFVGSPVWGYESKWLEVKTYKSYWPKSGGNRIFSETELRQYNGVDRSKPIYLALDGEVFDVTAGRHTYGPGGTYHHFAGVDHARAFITGCFKEHHTHDLRGMTEAQLGKLQGWRDFFRDHKTYFKVGSVIHAPIDPASPIPLMCKPKGLFPDQPEPMGPRKRDGMF